MESIASCNTDHDSGSDYRNRTNKKMRINQSVQSVPLVEVNELILIPAIATANKLGEDELLLIFRELSTRDLLNFRLVSKIWRNAATSTLLRRDACYIALDNKSVYPRGKNDDDEDDDNYNGVKKSNFWQLGFKFKKKKTLTELTELMSKSPKFPASNFHVYTRLFSFSFDYTCYPDLMLFFKLHGDKIRTFLPRYDVVLEPLLHILSTYTPNIECLDLSKVTLLPSQENRDPSTKPTTKCISVKSLILNWNSSRNECTTSFHLLLSSLPKLSAIENVNSITLPHIIKEGKGHLVRNFRSAISEPLHPLIQQFVAVHPKLCQLEIQIAEPEEVTWCFTTFVLINALLESSKDTLQHVMLPMPPAESQTKLTIPRMKNLKSISLTGNLLSTTDEDEEMDEIQVDWMFEDGLSASQHFPGLVKLCLIDLNVEQTISRFFQFPLDSDGTPNENCLAKIESLEILESSLAKNSDLSLISKFSPNVRMLKLNCRDFKSFNNSFWLLFPSLEFLEISASNVVNDGFSTSTCIDQFFTGFSAEMCTNLRTGEVAAELGESLRNAEGLKSLRVAPSICDLLHLKELKLKFSDNLETEFGSRVTGLYAFSQMPRTQFIIAYDPRAITNGEENCYNNSSDDFDYVQLCFASIKPYVKIVYVKEY